MDVLAVSRPKLAAGQQALSADGGDMASISAVDANSGKVGRGIQASVYGCSVDLRQRVSLCGPDKRGAVRVAGKLETLFVAGVHHAGHVSQSGAKIPEILAAQ